MWGEEGPGAGPRAKGFLHAQGRAKVQLLGSALEAEGGPAGQEQPGHLVCSHVVRWGPQVGCKCLWPTLGHSEPGTLILSIPKCLSFPGLGSSTLACPPYPSLTGKLCQERKEVGGRAGGIQGALLG